MRRILVIAALLIGLIVTAEASRRRLLTQGSGSGSSSPTPELVWWKLNEGTGTAIGGSSSGGGDGGTTDAAWTTGIGGQCIDLNGTSSDASTSSSITYGTNAITISFWANLDATNSTRMILESSADFNGNNNSFAIYLDAGLLKADMFASGAAYHTANLAYGVTGTWKHWFIVFDRTTVAGDTRIWLDGVEQTPTESGSLGASANFAAYRLFVGARNTSSLFTDGRIDDVRIYSGDRNGIVSSVYANPQ